MEGTQPEVPYAPEHDEIATLYSFGSVVYMILLVWMLYDAYKRYGMHYWLVIIFFVQPLGAIVYGLIHAKHILHGLTTGGGQGKGLFGLGIKSRISRAEQALKVGETEALRAELAELYYLDKRYADAERLFKQVLETDKENQEALYYLALCRLDQNDMASAFEWLSQLIAKNKKYRFGVAWLRYADTMDALGRRDEALEEFRQLSRSFPRPLTEFAYAKKLADAGKPEKAREVLEYMLSTSSEAPPEDRTWLRQGRSLLGKLA